MFEYTHIEQMCTVSPRIATQMWLMNTDDSFELIDENQNYARRHRWQWANLWPKTNPTKRIATILKTVDSVCVCVCRRKSFSFWRGNIFFMASRDQFPHEKWLRIYGGTHYYAFNACTTTRLIVAYYTTRNANEFLGSNECTAAAAAAVYFSPDFYVARTCRGVG